MIGSEVVNVELNQKNYTFSAYAILRAFRIRLIKNV
jgi:hypothetical protein